MTAMPDQQGPDVLEEAGLWCIRMAHGDLTGEDRQAFDLWIARSDAHRRAFDDVVRTWHGMDEISLQPDMIAHRSQALEAFGEANRRKWPRRSPGLRSLFAVAASFVLLLLGYGLYGHNAFTAYETGTGERRIVRLDDGSRLSLDADTEVRVRYRDDRRELKLTRGRAKFEVAKDTLRPFTVMASDRIVVATGTEFSVELINHKLNVILYEGRVSVVGAPDPASPAASPAAGAPPARHEIHLMPGRELVASLSSGNEKVTDTDPGRTLTWETGLLTFEDEPLQIAVERVNRYSDAKLAVADAATARLPVNGVYAAGNSQAFIEGVTGVLPVRVEMRGGVRTFVR